MKEIVPLLKAYGEQPDHNAVLWKYLTFQKFVSFLTNKSFHYARLDQLEDTLEGINQRYLSQLLLSDNLSKSSIIDTKHPYYESFIFGDTLKQAEAKFTSKQKENFVLCWVESNRESAGLWNLYSEPGGTALRIECASLVQILTSKQTSFDHRERIASVQYGKVAYKNFIDPLEVASSAFKVSNTAFRKDESFKHEQEFRISIMFDNLPQEEVKGLKQRLSNELMTSIQIVIHPKSTEWQIENIRNLVQKFNGDLQVRTSELKLR